MLSCTIAEGVELRALEPWQAPEFYAHVEDVREHIRPWVPMEEKITDLESARGILQSYADGTAADGKRIYGLWVDGELGGVALFRIFDVVHGVCETGVWIAPEHQGRGLITTAVTRLIDWAVEVRGMQRVEWWCSPVNARSQAVAKRLGFSREAHLRSHYIANGQRQDTEIWGLLADEWRKTRTAL